MKLKPAGLIGIAVAVVGLSSIVVSAGTDWIYLSLFAAATGGAVFGASAR